MGSLRRGGVRLEEGLGGVGLVRGVRLRSEGGVVGVSRGRVVGIGSCVGGV
jgi:hypothetical protein